MSSVPLHHPDTARARNAPVCSSHGDLAVVDDPFADGYSVVIPAAGIAVSAHRFTTPDAAAQVADRLEGLADFAAAADREGRQALYGDPDLYEALGRAVADVDPDKVIAIAEPDYPEGDRTGASYAEGYDERRRAAKRARKR